MLVRDFYATLESKTVNRTVFPTGVNMWNRIHTGLKALATNTMPLILVQEVDKSADELIRFTVFRKVGNTTFIRMPKKPVSEESNIDIDATLIDALGYYVLAGLEKPQAKTYMGLYWQEVDNHEQRLIEADLSDEQMNTGVEYYSGNRRDRRYGW